MGTARLSAASKRIPAFWAMSAVWTVSEKVRRHVDGTMGTHHSAGSRRRRGRVPVRRGNGMACRARPEPLASRAATAEERLTFARRWQRWRARASPGTARRQAPCCWLSGMSPTCVDRFAVGSPVRDGAGCFMAQALSRPRSRPPRRKVRPRVAPTDRSP